jgi:hypothetical protein
MQKTTPKKPARPRAKAAAKTPAASAQARRLRKLAKKYRPPQSWYDETGCPFKPTK